MPYQPKLPEAVAEHFELVDWKGGPRQAFGRFGVVDLRTITLQRANSLVQRGFGKLRRRINEDESGGDKKGSGRKKKRQD